MTSPVRQVKYLIEYSFVRLIAGFLCLFPREKAMDLGKGLGRIIHKLLPSRLEIGKKNLLNVFPNLSALEAENIILRSWENLGAGAAEFVKMPTMSLEKLDSVMEVEGLEHLRQSQKSGKGILMITAHYGAWEIGAKFWPHAGFKTAVVARKIKNPYVNHFVTQIRSVGGVRVILARNAVRESIRWLKDGNLLAVLIDHRVTEGGLQIPFFNQPASTTSMPAILALRYSIPIVPAHCWREGNKIKVQVDPALNFSDLEPDEKGIFEATLRMNRIVEEWIKKRPEAWLWIHNRWKTPSS